MLFVLIYIVLFNILGVLFGMLFRVNEPYKNWWKL
jgi:hypothetical protein